MRVGIITFHRLHNYGSVLQAYALNKYLRNLGYDVKTIDYVQPQQHKHLSDLYERNSNPMSWIRNIQVFMYRKKLKKSKNRFSSFVEKNIYTTPPVYSHEELNVMQRQFDAIICGSDQIWNPLYYGFDEAYLLNFVNDKSKCISYAASIGLSQVEQKTVELYKNSLNKFNKVYVREETGAKILSKALGYTPKTVMDPVFLLSKQEWKKFITEDNKCKPYVLCYFIGNINGMREYALEIKKKTKLPLVVVRMNLRDMLHNYNRAYDSGPKEFLNLIYNARYVFTNSFHAVAFSLIFHKKFWVFQEVTKDSASQSRINDLLTKVNLKNRILKSDIEKKTINWEKSISFNCADELIKKEISSSVDLLNNALEDIKHNEVEK